MLITSFLVLCADSTSLRFVSLGAFGRAQPVLVRSRAPPRVAGAGRGLQERRVIEGRCELVPARLTVNVDARVGRGRHDDGRGHVSQGGPVHVARAA